MARPGRQRWRWFQRPGRGQPEDLDVSTATISNATISAKKLSTWREGRVDLNHSNKSVIIGWDHARSKPSGLQDYPNYNISLNDSTLGLDSQSVLTFSLAEIEGTQKISDNKGIDQQKKGSEKYINFTIELRDSENQSLSFSLSDYSLLQNQVDILIWKSDLLIGKKRTAKVFKSFFIPLENLRQYNQHFDFTRLTDINFVFNKSVNGVIAMDNLGFTSPNMK